MHGHMGNDRITTLNMLVYYVDPVCAACYAHHSRNGHWVINYDLGCNHSTTVFERALAWPYFEHTSASGFGLGVLRSCAGLPAHAARPERRRADGRVCRGLLQVNQLIAVRGAVPGHDDGYVFVRDAIRLKQHTHNQTLSPPVPTAPPPSSSDDLAVTACPAAQFTNPFTGPE